MTKKKKLLVIHLNEFNYNFLLNGSKKYCCLNTLKFLSLKKIKTFTPDKEQDKNLDPWVQSVSINTGKLSKNHKVTNIGQKITSDIKQIWDLLADLGVKCGVWGTMNSAFKSHKNIKFFFPDPWNHSSKAYPKNLNSYLDLPKYYAQNYLDFKNFKFFSLSFLFFSRLFFSKTIFYFLFKFFFYSKIILKRGLKNHILFFLFDIISLNIFKKLTTEHKTDFSLIFLNSLAHFQHNNWDEKSIEKDYFVLTDEIFRIILGISKDYDDIFIFNGFTQKKIKSEYILRPNNPLSFLKELGINFKSLEQNMTNGGQIFFSTVRDKNKAIIILKNYKCFGLDVFELKEFSNKRLFYRIQIKSYQKIDKNLFQNFSLNKLSTFFAYEKSRKKRSKTISQQNNKIFISNINFIKTTGKHVNTGLFLYSKLSKKYSNRKIINNNFIFRIMKDYFVN